MSTILSNQSFQDFLNTALQTDNELSNEEQQREAIIQQADEMTEQAKQAALDAGASLLPLGTIELAKSVGGLYEKGSKAFNAAKAFKAARDAKTAQVEKLKEDAYNKEVERAKSAGEDIPDKQTFMNDVDSTLREKQIAGVVDTAKSFVSKKINPILDEYSNRASNTIEALGNNTINKLTNVKETISNVVADKFGAFTDVADKVKTRYLQKFEVAKNFTEDQLNSVADKLNSRVQNTFNALKDEQGNLSTNFQEHLNNLTDLVNQKTPQSLAGADAILENIRTTRDATLNANKLVGLQKQLEDVVASKSQKLTDLTTAHQNRLDKLTSDKETLQGQIDELNKTKSVEQTGSRLEELGVSTRFRGSGFSPQIQDIQISKAEQLGKLQRQLNTKSQAIDSELASHSKNLTDIENSTKETITNLKTNISELGENIASKVGDQTASILDKAKAGFSAFKSGVGAVKTAIAPVTDVIGTALAPVAVFQGAMSAENLLKGGDKGNISGGLMDATNLKFGVQEAKGLVGKATTGVKSLFQTEQEAKEAGLKTAEQVTAKEVEETATKEGAETFAKSAGQLAGEDIAENIGKTAAIEAGSEAGIAAGGSAIPVVGEVLDLGLALFSVGEGIKDLFDKPRAPPPPPKITEAVQFKSQAGVY